MDISMEMVAESEHEQYVSCWAPTNHILKCDKWYTVERKPTVREIQCGARRNMIVAYVPVMRRGGADKWAREMADRIAYALNVA